MYNLIFNRQNCELNLIIKKIDDFISNIFDKYNTVSLILLITKFFLLVLSLKTSILFYLLCSA